MILQSEDRPTDAGAAVGGRKGVHRGGAGALPLVFERFDDWDPTGFDRRSADNALTAKIRQLGATLEEERTEAAARADALCVAAVERARTEWARQLECEREGDVARMAGALEQFAAEREVYFGSVEAEVVTLALAVAERILHREAKLDPLLLLGVVRVALQRLSEGSAVVLRVGAEEEARWVEALGAESRCAVNVRRDAGMLNGECCLETSVGKVHLGVAAQLQEIEKGFFDLLQHRPA